MKKRGAKLCALMMAAVMALTACGGSSNSGSGTTAAAGGQTGTEESSAAAPEVEIPEGESVSQEQDVVAAISVDFTTMDPMDTSDTLSGGIQRTDDGRPVRI